MAHCVLLFSVCVGWKSSGVDPFIFLIFLKRKQIYWCSLEVYHCCIWSIFDFIRKFFLNVECHDYIQCTQLKSYPKSKDVLLRTAAYLCPENTILVFVLKVVDQWKMYFSYDHRYDPDGAWGKQCSLCLCNLCEASTHEN